MPRSECRTACIRMALDARRSLSVSTAPPERPDASNQKRNAFHFEGQATPTATTDAFPPRQLRTHRKGRRHGIRNARRYRSLIFGKVAFQFSHLVFSRINASKTRASFEHKIDARHHEQYQRQLYDQARNNRNCQWLLHCRALANSERQRARPSFQENPLLTR
jgi:hypothetical protein